MAADFTHRHRPRAEVAPGDELLVELVAVPAVMDLPPRPRPRRTAPDGPPPPPPPVTPLPAAPAEDWRSKVWADSQRRAVAEVAARKTPAETPAAAAESPRGRIAGGVVLLGLAVVLFVALTDMEATGGSLRVHWLIAVAYTIGGKWGATLFLTVIGGYRLVTGLTANRKSR